MRAIFLCEGTNVPASRFRVAQFLPHFEAYGVATEARFAYDDSYNAAHSTQWAKLGARLKRIGYAAEVDAYDLVFLQRPAIPQSALGEKLAHWLNPNTVFDFDDSIWLLGTGAESPSRRKAFNETVARVQHVIAGNAFLAEQANAPAKTTIIPTVIDTDIYVPRTTRPDGPIVVGWMGTAGNFPFLEKIVPSLKAMLAARPDVRVRLVSNATFEPLVGVERVEQLRWTASSEVALLQSFDVGLMPLVDSPLTRGKCAFKMIQYMAVGAPVVVSAVGANVEVFGQTELGHLCPTHDWTDALLDLVDDASKRARLGAEGRGRAVAHYSIKAVLPEYLRIFETVSGRELR